MRNNQLIEPLKILLESASNSFSEYELMQALQAQGWLEKVELTDTVALYANHFLIYNALYQLDEYYSGHNKYLMITALAIRLINNSNEKPLAQSAETNNPVNTSTQLQETSPSDDNQANMEALRDYYLDWSNLDEATEQSVNQLLDSFWQKYVSEDDYLKALAIFEMPLNAEYVEIKKRYRQLAMIHHPDKGGSVEQFQRIDWAFRILTRAS